MTKNTYLEEAYKKTWYHVYVKEQEFVLKIEEENKLFSEFCQEQNITSWCIITAYNPYSKEYTEEENLKNNQELKDEIIQEGMKVFDAKGIPEDPNWEAELSFFVFDISEKEALRLATAYKQNAIVIGTIESVPKLLWAV